MSEITPKTVAAASCERVGGWVDSLDAALSVTAQGTVLTLETTRWADDEQGTEQVRHFRAVVVEGEAVPIVLNPDEYRAGVDAVVARLSDELRTAPLEEYPVHLARLRGRLYDLAEAGQEQASGDPACWCEHVHNGVGMQRVITIGGCPAHDPLGEHIVLDRATFEQRVNERFDAAVRKLGSDSLAFMPATIAALRQQILSLDVDIAEAAQAEQGGAL